MSGEIATPEGRTTETKTMNIHPDALRILVRAMEKDLKQRKPAEPAKQKGKINETQNNETSPVYHNIDRMDHDRPDRCGAGGAHDRIDFCGIDPARGSVV